MVDNYRFSRCILSPKNIQAPLPISSIQFQGQGVSLWSSKFWSYSGVKNFLKGHISSSSLFKTTEYSSSNISGRLVSPQSNQKATMENRLIVLSLLFRLGFTINKEKSNLLPSQDITYIVGHFLLAEGLVFPTLERVQELRISVQRLLEGYNTAHDYLVLVGKIASCLEMIPNARLFMRPIQMHLLQNWSPIRMSMDPQIPVTPWLKPHLKWGLQEANILKGQSVQPIPFTETVTTDASLVNWGGHMSNLTVQGRWSNVQKMSHINFLKMKAVYLTVKDFLPYLTNKNVLIQTDNSTLTCYLTIREEQSHCHCGV